MNRWGMTLLLTLAVLGMSIAGCSGHHHRDSEAKAPMPEVESQPAPEVVATTTMDSSMTVVSMAYPTGDPATSAILIEKAIPSEVALNKPFTYQITARNLTGAPLHNVIVSEGMSTNIDVTSTDPEGSTGEARTMSWELGTLGPEESKTIHVTAVATGRNRISSCASVTYNSMLCVDAVVVSPKLALTKSGPAEVLVCDDIVYKLIVSNTGTGTVSGVRVTDDLPEGLLAVDGKSSITIDSGTLGSGQSRAYELKVKASAPGKYSNKSSAASDGGLTAESGEVVTLVREPVLVITDKGPGRRYLGRRTTHDIVVSNTGDGDARDTVVTAALSANSTFVRASDGGELSDGVVTWRVGTIAAGGSKELSVTLSTDRDGVLTTTASADAYCANAVTASAETEYMGIPAILLEVIDLEDPVEIGQETTYQITATNQGSAPDTNITIVCSLEGNVGFVSSSGATESVAGDGSVEFAPLPKLNPGERATWNVVVKALETGDVRFHVRMTTDRLTRPVQETEATNLYK